MTPISRLALHPDLDECVLEDRLLMAYLPGQTASQFIPSSGGSPSFLVAGFSTGNSSGAGGTYPGPQYFYLSVGTPAILGGGPVAGNRAYATANLYNPGALLPTVQGATIGSGPGAGGSSNTSGYGGAISSGYNTALSSSNNFGMGPTALGSIAAHVSGASDQLIEARASNTSSTASTTNQDSGTMSSPPANAGQAPFSPQDRLMGKGLGSPGGLLIGPGMNSSSPSSTSPRP